jgi:hypothetical protein
VACYRHGWRDALRRIGFGWLAAAGIVYVALVLLVFPEWLATARLTAQTYSAYSGNWIEIGFASVPAVLLLAIAWRVLPQSGRAEPLLRAALIAGASYLLLAQIEQKSWFYHQLPALLTLLVALGVVIVARVPDMMSGRQAVPAALALAAILPGLLLLTAWRTQNALIGAYERQPLVQALRHDLRPGDPWAVISVTALPAFPTTAIEGYRWILRGPSLWPLPGAVAMIRGGNAETGAAIKTAVAEALADDLEKGRPKLIVIDHDRSTDLLPQDELLPMLLETPRFAAVWSGYRLVGAAGHYDLYVPHD